MYNLYESPLFFGVYGDLFGAKRRSTMRYISDLDKISKKDKNTLRRLAEKVALIGEAPEQKELIDLWRQHNGLKKTRPMFLCFPENSWYELVLQSCLETSNSICRACEWYLRKVIYRWEHFHDDFVIEPVVKLPILYSATGWGLKGEIIPATKPGGAVKFVPAVKDPDDISKLKFSTVKTKEEETVKVFQIINDIIGDILQVRVERNVPVDISLVNVLTIQLRGMAQVLLDMYDRPEWLHQLMSFLCEGTQRILKNLEETGNLDLNNEDDYVGSGGLGYTDELPGEGFDGQHVRIRDLWGFAEAQPLSSVAPGMFEEFFLQYQIRLLRNFGLNCYACCEPMDTRYEIIKKIPRLRRVSVSPFADIRIAAQNLEDKYIFSWKPNPADLAAPSFHPQRIKQYIEETLEVADGCVLEIVMKDVHTVNYKPERLDSWMKIARELITLKKRG